MRINLKLSALAAVISFVATSVVSASNDGIRCVNSSEGTCVLPIFALYNANLGKLKNLKIVTSGFMKRYGNDYLLFVDKEMADLGVFEQAFNLIDGDKSFKMEMSSSNGEYVRLAGKVHIDDRSIYWADIVLIGPPLPVPVTEE